MCIKKDDPKINYVCGSISAKDADKEYRDACKPPDGGYECWEPWGLHNAVWACYNGTSQVRTKNLNPQKNCIGNGTDIKGAKTPSNVWDPYERTPIRYNPLGIDKKYNYQKHWTYVANFTQKAVIPTKP